MMKVKSDWLTNEVFVVCEESQTLTKAFISAGIPARSVDLQPCSGGRPDLHIQGDCFSILNRFRPAVVIAHPPCTFLTSSGAPNNKKQPGRIQKGFEAAHFFRRFIGYFDSVNCLLAIENPTPQKIFGLPPYSQIISPHNFGSDYSKRTCLWLYGLPPVIPLLFGHASVINPKSWVYSGSSSAKRRSKTDPVLASAMVDAWKDSIISFMGDNFVPY